MNVRTLVLGALALGIAGPAMAAGYSWDWTPNSGVGSYNDGGGKINWIQSEFNESTKRLTWYANFEGSPTSSIKPDGFALAISDGEQPRGVRGKYALLYFDAKRTNDERLTVYGYNGRTDLTSWKDGNGVVQNNQTPDRMKSSLVSTDWIFDRTDRTEVDGSRTLGFDIDASSLISHTPAYPGQGGAAAWKGAQYGSQIGAWFSTVSGLSTQYYDTPGYSKHGFLKKWESNCDGYLKITCDETAVPTDPVPEPSTVALLGLGFAGAIATRLRKRQK